MTRGSPIYPNASLIALIEACGRCDSSGRRNTLFKRYPLTDVHRYLTLRLNGRRVAIDAMFPGEPRDGRSGLPRHAVPERTISPAKTPTASRSHSSGGIATRRSASHSSGRP
jgi:hypothetical protein